MSSTPAKCTPSWARTVQEKSTLSYVLSGRDGYDVTGGEVLLDGKNLLDMDPEERACEGVFLGFQYPVEIPGVPGTTFLKTAVNAVRRYRGESEFDAMQFIKFIRAKAKGIQCLRRDVEALCQLWLFRR